MERIPTPKPGLYPGIPFEVYLAWDAVDATLLKAMAHNAEFAHFRMIEPEVDKPCYLKGRLFHLLSTDPNAADGEFILQPDTYVSDKGEEKGWHAGAKVCKAWVASQKAAGLDVLKADVLADACGMATRVREHPRVGPLVISGAVEVSVVWLDKPTGIVLKARYDVYKNGIIVDLKSDSGRVWAGDYTANPFFRVAYNRGYHIACGMYVDSVIALKLSKEVPWYVFVAVEGYPPYSLAAYDVRDDQDSGSYAFLHLGRLRYRMLLQEYAHCKKTGEWPGYGAEHEDMMLSYAGVKELEQLTGGAA